MTRKFARLFILLTVVVGVATADAAVRFGNEIAVASTRAERMQSFEDGVWNGSEYVLLWRDWHPSESSRPLMYGRFKKSGERVDGDGIRLLRDRNVSSALLAFDGSRYLLVWVETSTLPVRHDTFAVMLSPSLNEAAAKTQIASGHRAADVVWNGSSFVVAFVKDDGTVWTGRIGDDGKLRNALQVVAGPVGATDAAVALGGDRILLISREGSRVRSVPLTVEGAKRAADTILTTSASGDQDATVASSGDGFATAWERNNGGTPVVTVQIFDSAGLPAGAAFDLTGSGADPSVTYDGEHFIVSSIQPAPTRVIRTHFVAQNRTQVRASAVVTPSVSDDVTVIPAGTRHLLVYENQTSTPSGNVDRVAARVMDDSVDHTPAMPENVTARYLGNGRGELEWVDASDNEIGFAIERRRADEVSFVHIASLLPNTTRYEMNDLIDGVNYVFRIRSFTSAKFSQYTNEVLMSSCPVPSAPTVFTLNGATSNSFAVSWVDPATTPHEIQLEAVRTADNVTIVRKYPPGVTAVVIDGLMPSTEYTLRIRNISACGASAALEIQARTFPVRRRTVRP